MIGKVIETSAGFALLDLEEFPGIDENTEDGRAQLGAIAFHANRRHPSVTHFQFLRAGKVVGEMIVPPPVGKMN